MNGFSIVERFLVDSSDESAYPGLNSASVQPLTGDETLAGVRSMNHPKKSFKLDLMAALMIIVLVGVTLTMIAQAGEGSSVNTVVVAYQAAP